MSIGNETDGTLDDLLRRMYESEDAVRSTAALLRKELGDAIEGCSLYESVALLVSQRENARNAHAATQERLALVEKTAVLRHAKLRDLGYKGPPVVAMGLAEWAEKEAE